MSDDHPNDGQQQQTPTEPSPGIRRIAAYGRVMQLITEKKIDTALWATRLLTMFFAFGYVVPIFGNPVSFYYKAFLATAATSALRLHQRLPNITLTRAFLGQLLMEDSCHYLFYSLIFIYSAPISLALSPAVMFALLHFASFSLTILDALGRNSGWIGRVFISLIEYKTVTILRMAAGAEIFTMLFVILYPLLGRASLLTPFLYYRFLTLRYASRRNHYTRTMFYELRIQSERLASSSKCPGALSSAIHKGIELLSRLAPTVPPAS